MDKRRAKILKLVSRNYPSLSELEEALRHNHMQVSNSTIKRDITKLREVVNIQYSNRYKGYYISK